MGVDVGLEMAELETVGACLCGAVRFTIRGPLRDVLACHCGQCRKSSGHFWAATAAPRDAFTFQLDDGLTWFQSSQEVKRGFVVIAGPVSSGATVAKIRFRSPQGLLRSPPILFLGGISIAMMLLTITRSMSVKVFLKQNRQAVQVVRGMKKHER